MAIEAPGWIGFRDLLLSSMRIEKGRAGRRVIDAELWVDYARDEMQLVVKHRLCTRREMENREYSAIGDRLREALCVPKPDWKDLRVLRRQLHWRGKQATNAKPKKLRKIK